MHLKEMLGACHKYEWQRAQAIFDRMNALTGAQGPSGCLMAPRSCKACGYFGHTKQWCNKRAAVEALKAKLDNQFCKPAEEEECTAEQWQWVLTFREQRRRYQKAIELGMGCTEDGADDCVCIGCRQWDAFMCAPQGPGK